VNHQLSCKTTLTDHEKPPAR